MTTETGKTSARGVLSLISGVLALLCLCPVLGSFVAIALGSGQKDGMARAGVILGWLALLVFVALALFTLLFLLAGGFWAVHA
jgi:hypothetical protein